MWISGPHGKSKNSKLKFDTYIYHRCFCASPHLIIPVLPPVASCMRSSQCRLNSAKASLESPRRPSEALLTKLRGSFGYALKGLVSFPKKLIDYLEMFIRWIGKRRLYLRHSEKYNLCCPRRIVYLHVLKYQLSSCWWLVKEINKENNCA